MADKFKCQRGSRCRHSGESREPVSKKTLDSGFRRNHGRKTLRILDANLNRAREGIRVVEDAARYMWDAAPIYRCLRSLRHQLHELSASHYGDLLEARESQVDVGRTIREKSRSSVQAVLASNMRRAQEAIRVLEEYNKVFSPKTSDGFKKVRYRLYIEEKKIFKRLGMK